VREVTLKPHPSHIISGERTPATPWIGVLVGCRSSLDIVAKRKVLVPVVIVACYSTDLLIELFWPIGRQELVDKCFPFSDLLL